MWTIIIFAVVTTLYVGYREYDGYYTEWFDVIIASFLSFILSVFPGVLIALALPADLYVEETRTKLEVLNDNNSVSGGFILGSGQVEGEMKYVFYTQTDNRYKLNQVKYDKAEIEYSDEIPEVITYSEKYTDDFINYFAIDITKKWYLFKIPEGSISNGFKLDAK